MREAASDPRLARLVLDACRHVPLYRRLWGEIGKAPGTAPRLDKAALRACTDDERIDDRRRHRKLTQELSSGSSGEPLKVFYDRATARARRFAFLRALVHCGYRPGQACLLLTSRRDSRGFTLVRWHYAGLDEDTPALAARVRTVSPRVLYGPLSTLELLARHFTGRGERLPGLRLVVSTAEQLTRERLAVLQAGFDAPVADFYGLSEFGLVAFRPPGGTGFRIARRSLLLEFDPVPGEGDIERLVVTDLAERTAPLVRYDTGDFVRRDRSRPERPIVGFAGRAFDCLLLPGGLRVSPYRIDMALEHLPELRGFEVVQQKDLSIDVTIEAAPRDVERLRGAIAEKLTAIVGADLPCRIAPGTILRSGNGTKFRAIRSAAGAGA